jgi:hypothetical protein
MPRRRFWVDWSDPYYPHIRTEETAGKHETLQSMGECKEEIIEHFQNEISHARAIIEQTRKWVIADSINWDKEFPS